MLRLSKKLHSTHHSKISMLKLRRKFMENQGKTGEEKLVLIFFTILFKINLFIRIPGSQPEISMKDKMLGALTGRNFSTFLALQLSK